MQLPFRDLGCPVVTLICWDMLGVGPPSEAGSRRTPTPFAESALRRSLEQASARSFEGSTRSSGDRGHERVPSLGAPSPAPAPQPPSPPPAQSTTPVSGTTAADGNDQFKLRSEPSLTSLVTQQALQSPQPLLSPHISVGSRKEGERNGKSSELPPPEPQQQPAGE